MEWLREKMDYRDNAVVAFHEQLKQHNQRMIQRFKEVNPDIIIIPHRDGAVEDLLCGNKEIGFEVLNPVQPCVPGHLPLDLKDNFGDNFAFWGEIHQQDLLPNGIDEELENDIIEKINILG
jgi:uroporphyrinogen decarboxylase